jgi:hypothetical protein
MDVSGHYPVTSTISLVRDAELKNVGSFIKEVCRREGEKHAG